MQKILKQIGIFSSYKKGKLLIKGKNFEKNEIKKVKVLDLVTTEFACLQLFLVCLQDMK